MKDTVWREDCSLVVPVVLRSTSPHWNMLEITAQSHPPQGSPPLLVLSARPSSKARHCAKCIVNRRRTMELAFWVGRAAVSRSEESVFSVTDPSVSDGGRSVAWGGAVSLGCPVEGVSASVFLGI